METVISIIAIVLSVISGIFALLTFLWTNRRDRKQATLEAYNRLQTDVFDNLNTYAPAEIKDICIDVKSAEYKMLSGYLARIEHFCVGINEKIYDKDTFYSLAHGYFDGNQLRKRIEPLLDSKNQSNNTKELFYIHTISVLMWMEKKSNNKKEKGG